MAADLLSFSSLGTTGRIVLVLAVAAFAHLAVRVVRHYTQRLLSNNALMRWAKLRTLVGLITSVLVFTLYFLALGLILREFGVSLTAYLASASILGLAIGFGSQGLVQDVVTGLTVIFSDLFQVGDLVEISGQTGVVEGIGMRFTVLLNPLGAQVFIPNRTLSNVVVYPRGYVRCFADITLASQQDKADLMLEKIKEITDGFLTQYRGIFRDQPEIEAPATTPAGRSFVRVKFRIWPGRSAPIEGAYKPEVVETLKRVDAEYDAWMVNVNSEISEAPRSIQPFRMSRSRSKVIR